MAEITLENLNAELAVLDGGLPIALFPVKIQTRFATAEMVATLGNTAIPPPALDAPPTELWVRIYPDDIFVHSHEERLTEEEYEAAKVYWNTLWEHTSASDRHIQKQGAWQYLVEDYGPVRAQYIISTTQPASGIDAEGFPHPGNPPELPALEKTTESWTQAARTYLLPDRFIIDLYKDGHHKQYAGNMISKTEGALQLGLDPQSDDQFEETPGGRQVPEAIRWLTDFPKALEVGMAVRIPLTEWEAEDQIDELVVLGWRSQESPTDAKAALEKLFHNHRYKVGGMDLSAVGAPTNNTREHSAQARPEDRSAEESLQLQQEQDGDDPQLLARALGLNGNTFSNLDHSQQSSITEARKVHELLFDVTLGQALDFWQPGASPTLKSDLRQHFVNWISGRGHLPILCIDDQPYGILPALSYHMLNNDAPFTTDSFLGQLWGNILQPLQGWYQGQIENVSQIKRGMDPRDAQLKLLSILQLHPTSVTYRQRFAVKPEVEDNADLLNLLRIQAGDLRAERSGKSVVEELSDRGFPSITAAENLLYEHKTYPILVERDSNGVVVDAADEDVLLGTEGGVIPPLPGLEINYVQWLAAADLDTLADTNPPGDQPPYAILYHLLRHRLLMSDGEQAQALAQDIQHWPAEKLRRMVQEHLDCCTYRLDAWLSSFAAQRLDELRTAAPDGIQIGAWGYLESLKPQRSHATAEYIPTPSLRHATAAAVLRSGFNNNRSSGTDGNLFAVDLSASRVKNALYLLEGVRKGQDLSALLGYRLERAMQEYRDSNGMPVLAPFIQDLREKYRLAVLPLVQSGQNSAPETTEDQSQHVIDVLALLEDQPGWETIVDASLHGELEPVISDLDEQLDSVKDLLAAEGVYQLVDGQTDRAKAALDAMTDGGQLTRPEVVDQPRSSLPLSFRMGVLLQHSPLPVTGGAPLSPRALVGSKVNRWLFDKLPDISFIKARVRWVSGTTDTGEPEYEATTLPLRHLLIEPIDLAYMMHLQRENPDTSELKYRIEREVRQQNNLPLTTRIEILERDRTGFNASDYTLFAIEPLAAGLGKLMMETRSLRPEDFLSPNSEAVNDAGQFWAPSFLRSQLRNVVLKMEDMNEDLERELDNATGTLNQPAPPEGDENAKRQREKDIEQRLKRLQDLTFYYAGLGWVKAVPTVVERLDNLTLDQEIRRSRNILEDARSRMNQSKTLWGGAPDASLSSLLRQSPEQTNAEQETELLVEVIKLLFGKFYRVYPDFKFPDRSAAEQSLNDPQLQASTTDFAVEQWLQTQAPMRPNMDLYYRADMLTELFGGTKERADGYSLLQLPIRDGSPGPWVGQEYGDFIPHGDTMAMTLELQKDFDFNDNTFSGLLIDEWQELVPDPQTNAGIALQYDQPNTEAPNVALLAMTHRDGAGWNWESLLGTVQDSLEVAKMRAVDPDLINMSFLDQFLPAVLGPVEVTEDDGNIEMGGLLFGPAYNEQRELSPAATDITDTAFDNVDLGNTVDE